MHGNANYAIAELPKAHLPTHRRLQIRDDMVQTHQDVRSNRGQRIRLQRPQPPHHLLLVLAVQQRRQRDHYANRRFAHARRRVRQPQNHLRENIAVHHAAIDQFDVAVQILRLTRTPSPYFQQLQTRRAVLPAEQLRDQRRNLLSTMNPSGKPNEKRSAGRLLPMMITEGRTIGANSVCPCTNSSISSGKMNSTVIACTRAPHQLLRSGTSRAASSAG